MARVVFFPLNINHALNFGKISESLECEHVFLCHDRVSENERYHTEATLQKLGLPLIHFPEALSRDADAPLATRILHVLKLKRQFRQLFRQVEPKLVVLAIDNDPLARIAIDEAKRAGIPTALVQEALIHPREFVQRKTFRSEPMLQALRSLGIHLSYSQYGSAGCDWLLAIGPRAKKLFCEAGVPDERVAVVGYPRYDDLVRELKSYDKVDETSKTYLYAASSKLLRDAEEIEFLKELAASTERLGVPLIVKLHPRVPDVPSDVYALLESTRESAIEVTKSGQDAIEILKTSYALITISSTVVLEGLILDKECIVVNYLAREKHFEYDEYDATFPVNQRDETFSAVQQSLAAKKAFAKKVILLEDELYKLDGKSGERAARFIEDLVS